MTIFGNMGSYSGEMAPYYGQQGGPDPNHPAMRGVAPENLATEWARFQQFGGANGGGPALGGAAASSLPTVSAQGQVNTAGMQQGASGNYMIDPSKGDYAFNWANPLAMSGQMGGIAGAGGNPYSGQQGDPRGGGATFVPGTNGSSGGLGVPQYGYGQAPGSSNRGYYQQQTPVGSFAAADQQSANVYTANNPYIGQRTGMSVLPYAQQVAAQSQQANPYLGQQSQQAAAVGQNAYAGANPYLEQAIGGAVRNATQGFNDVVNPQFDRMSQASGSFGNTGVEAARGRAQQEFGQNLGNMVSGMRMQDYTAQQQLGEAALNRQQQNNQFNAGLGAADLNRNLLGAFTGQNLGIQGLNSLVGAAQFDAGLANNDLGRNSTLAQNLGMFNAGAGNQNSMFNAGQGNAMNQFNAGSGNAMLGQVRGLNENARQFDAGLGQRQNEFNQNMDFNTWAANNNNMRLGNLDQMNFINNLMNWQGQGVNAGTNINNQALNDYLQFVNAGSVLGGQGGTATQNLQGNPLMGAIGGGLTVYDFLNRMGR